MGFNKLNLKGVLIMKKLASIVLCITILFSLSAMTSAAATSVPATLEIKTPGWNVGDPMYNMRINKIEVKPSGNITEASYSDKTLQSVTFVVKIDADFVSNGKASVNGKEAEIKKTGENLYEVSTSTAAATATTVPTSETTSTTATTAPSATAATEISTTATTTTPTDTSVDTKLEFSSQDASMAWNITRGLFEIKNLKLDFNRFLERFNTFLGKIFVMFGMVNGLGNK